MGYDDMGYELWKPYLRSMMECDMKAVSIGTKRKAEVLATCLDQMKACFLDARLNKLKLLEAMAVFFERSNRSAGGEQHSIGEVVRRCNLCQESDMVLKRKPDGNFMVGCLGFPQCRNVVWLPGSILEATVTTNICSFCTPGPVFRIQFKFRRLEIPPNYNVEHLGCIYGCDEILRQLTEICGTGSRNHSGMPARGRGSTTSSNSSFQRSNIRPSACVHCSQAGHSSNDCPSQASRFRNTRSSGMNSQGEASIPCNTCGAPCTLRTANTANNRGRKFYSCQSQECNFFVWEDSMNNSNGGRGAHRANVANSASNPRRGGRVNIRGNSVDVSFVSATGDPISGRRCYVCGDPSHFANVCPNRGM